MASLDSLPSDQKAVLSLVLQRGRSFDEIAALLSIDRAAVRQRALEGCDALGPETTLDPLKRALITDYLLGQLPGKVAASVRGSLATNPSERGWARVIAAEIAPLAANGLPEIPAPGRTASPAPAPAGPAGTGTPGPDAEEPRVRAEAAPGAGRGGRGVDVDFDFAGDESAVDAASSGSPTPASSRRGGAILLGLIALVIVVVVVILTTSGGSTSSGTHTAAHDGSGTQTASPNGRTATPSGTSTSVTALKKIILSSPTSAKGVQGAADVVRASGRLGLVLVARGLAANTTNAYGVWLYDPASGQGDFLGFYGHKVAASGATKGFLEAEVALPANAAKYTQLLLTLETGQHPTKPGTIVLEGAFAE